MKKNEVKIKRMRGPREWEKSKLKALIFPSGRCGKGGPNVQIGCSQILV